MAFRPRLLLGLVLLGAAAGVLSQQLTLEKMPRYDRYDRIRRQISGSIERGALTVRWAEDGKSFTYPKDGKNYRYDVATAKIAETPAEAARPPGRRGQRGGPERGRQFDVATSNSGKRKAFHRNRNVWISDVDGKHEVAVTTDGSAEQRTKYGIASWVYGEELGVREAMWWSPDDKKLAFYRFDEREVPDYFLQYDQTKFQDTLDVEAYPKAGMPNPGVTLLVYDVASQKTVRVNTDFDSGGGADLGHYVFDVRWSKDGEELYFNRANRKQNVTEWCAANPSTGASRLVIRESQPQSWAENHPTVRILSDNRRVIWMSERNGFRNLYLYELSGKLLNPITQGKFDVGDIVQLDEARGLLWYSARSAENPYLTQLHRVGLDGRGDKRLTAPELSHSFHLAPDGRHFVDVQERADVAPTTILRDADGKAIRELATSNLTKYEQLGLKRPERFTFTAADGKTVLYGSLHFPSDFDPAKKHPLLIGVYGGPESGGGAERFLTPDPITELGFLVATMDGRGTSMRGKAFKDAVYGKLGVVEIDDHAAGVRHLASRPYVDGKRVGIHGTSYGGYFSVMAILRHPEVFHVALASSPVTDWRHYDTIYTERYMGLPWDNENKAGYDAGSAMKYAGDLKGRLMLYYGTADNNVHPSNTLQFVQELNRRGKRFDMMVGPDQGHSGIGQTRLWEYFVQYLILNAEKDPLSSAWSQRPRTRETSKKP